MKRQPRGEVVVKGCYIGESCNRFTKTDVPESFSPTFSGLPLVQNDSCSSVLLCCQKHTFWVVIMCEEMVLRKSGIKKGAGACFPFVRNTLSFNFCNWCVHPAETCTKEIFPQQRQHWPCRSAPRIRIQITDIINSSNLQSVCREILHLVSYFYYPWLYTLPLLPFLIGLCRFDHVPLVPYKFSVLYVGLHFHTSLECV